MCLLSSVPCPVVAGGSSLVSFGSLDSEADLSDLLGLGFSTHASASF